MRAKCKGVTSEFFKNYSDKKITISKIFADVTYDSNIFLDRL